MPTPLIPDSTRQAAASIRGYRYQILRSIYEWLELRDDETLYLEGAEDIDRISEASADTFQVKDTKASVNVTLRSAAVRDAINNFWKLRSLNPNRKIRYHLITTSGIAVEQGSPFSDQRPGLEVWREAAATQDVSVGVRLTADVVAFLRGDNELSPQVLQYLGSASAEQVLSELVKPLAWHTSSASGEQVEAAALRKLQNLCWDRRVPLEYAHKVLSRLEKHVWQTITQADGRSLTIEDFRIAFEREITVPVAHHDLMDLIGRASVAPLASMPLTGAVFGNHLEILSSGSRAGLPPPLPVNVMARNTIQADVRRALHVSGGVVQIYGTTGTGKTTEASLLARSIGSEWLWLSCRGADDTQIRGALALAGRWLDHGADRRHLACDDVDFERHIGALETHLPGLLFTIRTRGGALVITAHREIPQRLRLRLGIDERACYCMPYFTEEEVDEYLNKRGCGDAQLRASWKTIVFLKTRGHPQLVVAQVSALAQSGFPSPRLQDFVEKSSVVREAEEEARLLLANNLPVHQRELLYRLSLLVGRFSRDHAIAIGHVEPVLPNAGDIFDRLVGPWIEKPGEAEFQISPLIQGAGQAANGAAWSKDMHAAIAEAWVHFREQSAWTISSILFHAVIGNNGGAVARVYVGLHDADETVWAALANADAFFVYVYAEEGKHFSGWTAFEVFCARLLQLKFAARSKPEQCLAVLTRVEEEFPHSAQDPMMRVMRQMLLAQLVVNPSIPLPLAQVIRAMTDVVELGQSVPADLQRKTKGSDGQHFDPAPAIGMAFVQRTKTIEDIAEVVRILDGMEPHLRGRALALFSQHRDMGRQFADAVWLNEHKSAEPRWQALADALGTLVQRAIHWSELVFAQAVASVRGRVLYENLDQAEQALSSIDDPILKQKDSYLLMDVRAKILSGLGRYDEALSVWKECLPDWKADSKSNSVALAYALRSAAIAAARTGDWSRAGELFESGHLYASRSVDRHSAVGLLADAAYAYWRAHMWVQAIDCFVRALIHLEDIPNKPDDIRNYYLHKIIGHVLSWATQKAHAQAATLEEPSPGCCSFTEPSNEVAQLNPTPIEFSWTSVLSLAASFTAPDQLEARLTSLRDSQYPGVRMRTAEYQIERSLRSGNVARLVAIVYDLQEALVSLQKQEAMALKLWDGLPRAEKKEVLERFGEDFAKLYLCRGLLSHVASAPATSFPLAEWTSDCERLGIDTLRSWLIELRATTRLSQQELLDILRAPDEAWPRRLVACAVILNPELSSPVGILYAHITLLMMHDMELGRRVEREVAGAIASTWRAVSNNRAVLKMPNLTVPQIQSACNEQDNNWRKTARIALAAHDAVDLGISPNIMQRIISLAS